MSNLARPNLAPVGAVALALLAGQVALAADWTPGKYMQQAMTRVMAGVKKIGDRSNYGYDEGICLMAAFVRPRGTVTFNRPVRRGEQYLVVGGGDDDVNDLDIEVFDANGRLVAKDTKADAAPFVLFTAPSSGQYRIRQKLYRASEGSFCAVAVLRRGGYSVPVSNLAACTARTLGMCKKIASRRSKVGFLARDNQWSLYGSVLKPNESFTITGIRFGAGQRIITAAADRVADDIDLFVLNEDEKVVSKDVDKDATPICYLTVKGNPSNGIRVKNVGKSGPTLTMAAVLQVGG